VQRATESILQQLPSSSRTFGVAARQQAWLPLYSPVSARPGMNAAAVEVTPLYAGVCVRDIHRVVPAAEAVAELVEPRR
jgi:hypothetical protein